MNSHQRGVMNIDILCDAEKKERNTIFFNDKLNRGVRFPPPLPTLFLIPLLKFCSSLCKNPSYIPTFELEKKRLLPH